MTSRDKEKTTITHKIKTFVDAVIEMEASSYASEKEAVSAKSKLLTNKLRVLKRELGLETSHSAYGKYAPRTVMKYLSTARKMLRETNLVAPDAEQQALKMAKAYKMFSGVLSELAQSENIKRECQDMINNPDTPNDLKRVLRKLKLEHPAYYRLMNTKIGSKLEEVKIAKKESDNSAVVSKNRGESDKALRLSKPLIIKAVEEGLRVDQKFSTRMALAVILCTGRRNIEILKTGNFEVVNEKTILFSGQAKKKFGEEAKSYEIPVMFADAQSVVNCVNRLRKTPMCQKLNGLDNETIAKRVSSTLSDCARALLKNDNASFYSARAAYSFEAYGIYTKSIKGNRPRQSLTAYIATLLGHDQEDLNTAKSYQGVTVSARYTEEKAAADYEKQKKKNLAKKLPKTKEKHPLLGKLVELEKKLPELESNKRSLNTQTAIVQWLIASCKGSALFSVTATNIRKCKGGRMEPIKEVIAKLDRIK